MRNANGFGNVSKLSGKRRNPWRARITTGWVMDETTRKAKQQYKTIGYFPTRQKAMEALLKHNSDPNALDAGKITFAEVYERWSVKKFESIAKSNIDGYKAAFNTSKALHQMKFSEIKLSHLQAVVDDSGKNVPALKKLKTLFNQLFDFAVIHEIIPKDRHMVEYVKIGKGEKSDKHYRFTNEEIAVLWENSENEYVKFILMLIYTGVRPGELFDLKRSSIDLGAKVFTVEKGKTVNAARKVPIHERVYPFFEYWSNKNTEYLFTVGAGRKIVFENDRNLFVSVCWNPILNNLGILKYTNEKGEIRDHLPDDTRHTFSTMWKEKKLDEAMRRKIQGHSGKGIGEEVYTHFNIETLREELNKL